MPAASRALGPALLVALLAAALGVAAFVYRERTPDLALDSVRITPAGRKLDRLPDGQLEPAHISFIVRFDEPDATVAIVGRHQRRERVLDRHVALEAGRRVSYVWDGRDQSGQPARRGRYRLRVVLPGQDRDMVFPKRIAVGANSGRGAP